MNKQIRLAVAGAVLASASAAQAGIIIPAGDWSLDIGGNVNMYSVWTKASASNTVAGGITALGETGTNTSNNMTTGLLPNFLSVSGSSRQNDLDVGFTISIQPGASNTSGAALGTQNNRQAFMTFGDKSWGSVKIGKDLGIFGSDAILSDMTLLGVGSPSLAGGNTTYGRIGTGYIYADWKPQIAFTTPNFGGFQATAGITQNWGANSLANVAASGGVTAVTADSTTGGVASTISATSTYVAATSYSAVTSAKRSASPAFEGKASYSFAANDVTGKVWVSGIANRVNNLSGVTVDDSVAYAGDIGANLNAAGFGLTGYYYAGQGIGTTAQMMDGYSTTGKARDSDGGYVQATYILPIKTKLGASWGISNLDKASGEAASNLVKENEMWTIGAYHPLTKSLNLVAEYSHVKSSNHNNAENKTNNGSLGAILFF